MQHKPWQTFKVGKTNKNGRLINGWSEFGWWSIRSCSEIGLECKNAEEVSERRAYCSKYIYVMQVMGRDVIK